MNILEHEEVFKRTLGEYSEIITKEMYFLKDLSDNTLVLRPEGTAGLMRMILESNMRYQLPRKLYYEGPMFRYERPQKGRLRQFYQIGAENLGSKDYFADVEIIVLGQEILKALKPSSKFKVEINSLGNFEERREYNKALLAYFSQPQNREKLSELSKIRLERKNPLRILDSKEKCDIELLEKSPKIKSFLEKDSINRFENIKKVLEKLGVRFMENENLVRGLDYYCHACFEIKEDDPLAVERAQSTLIGGGRYDFLANYLSGVSEEKDALIPATGFAAGIERIANLLDEDDLERLSEKEPKILKVGLVPIQTKGCSDEKKMSIKMKLMEIMKTYEDGELSFELLGGEKKPDKQFEYLEKRQFDFALIMGESEFENGKVKVKDLAKRVEQTFDLAGFSLIKTLDSFKK